MYVDNETGEEIPDLRKVFPNVSFPSVIEDSTLLALGVSILNETPPPTTSLFERSRRGANVKDESGRWSFSWEILQWSPGEIEEFFQNARERMWYKLMDIRDRRKSQGVLVGENWFHTDADSRIQWLGLKDSARDLLAEGGLLSDPVTMDGSPILWKTMSGSFVPVTVSLAFQMVHEIKRLDAALFLLCEQKKAELNASESPHEFDTESGWIPGYHDIFG